jgi:phospholipid/cholesterol/gamma-HCH transport system ATP-binding protein
MSETVIEALDLCLGYDDFVVLEGLGFSVGRGEVFGILGGSGCGKSTTLKHLIGLNAPLSGDILIKGRSIVSATESEREDLSREFGVLYQSGALFSSLTLEENVALPIREALGLPWHLLSALARVKLSQVGLRGFEDFLPSEISGGMRKRAGLARAMALSPDILFFDEPSAGLDPISSADLDKLILDLRDATGTTMVIVTHELDSIFSVMDRVIILDKETKGIVASGDPRELREGCPNVWVREFLGRKGMRR